MYWRIKNSLSIMKNNLTKKHLENITNNEGMGVVEVILIIVEIYINKRYVYTVLSIP